MTTELHLGGLEELIENQFLRFGLSLHSLGHFQGCGFAYVVFNQHKFFQTVIIQVLLTAKNPNCNRNDCSECSVADKIAEEEVDDSGIEVFKLCCGVKAYERHPKAEQVGLDSTCQL